MESIGIPNITAVFSTSLHEDSQEKGSGNATTNESPLKTVYEALAKEFEVETSEKGYTNFAEAVNQITEAKVAACEDGSGLSEGDVPRLANKYGVLKEDFVANVVELRGIFGKMMCLSEKEHEDRKRMRRDSYCPDRKDCKCPGNESLIICVCEFFDCLDPEDNIKPIMGISYIPDISVPCLAFIVDTTGSMETEISAVKEVIRTFLSSEEGTYTSKRLYGPGCYVLQPFNDYKNGMFDPTSMYKAIICTVLCIMFQCVLCRYSRGYSSKDIWTYCH